MNIDNIHQSELSTLPIGTTGAGSSAISQEA